MEHLFHTYAPEIDTPLPSEFSEEARAFYHVPGHAPVNDRDLLRYRRSQKVMAAQPAAPKAIPWLQNPAKEGSFAQMTAKERFIGADRSQQRELMQAIERFAKDDRAELIALGLSSAHPEVQSAAMIRIPSANAADKPSLSAFAARQVRHGLENGPDQKRSAIAISFVPRIYWPALIQIGLDSDSVDAQAVCVELVRHLPPETRSFFREQITTLISGGLRSPDEHTATVSARMIAHAEPQDRVELIEKGFSTARRPNIQKICSESIDWWDEKTCGHLQSLLPNLIDTALASPSMLDQRSGAAMIASTPLESLGPLIEKGSRSPDPEARRLSLKALDRLPREAVARILAAGLEAKQPDICRSCVEYVKSRPNALLDFPDVAEILYADFADPLIEPFLYKQTQISGEGTISRTPLQNKSGYETTVLGGKLKGKVVIRRLEEHAFRAWKWLYEQHAYWKESGFDYVPIEPIVSFRQNARGLIEVATGVLDLSLYDWNEMGGRFGDELQEECYQIADAVSRTGIEHLDIADRNFCLRFFRDEQGKADLTRKPRLYLIDFDHVSRR